jgi:hypothetical protein
MEPVVAGTSSEAPFIAWYSETPVDPRPRPAADHHGDRPKVPNGWVVNMTPEPQE